MITFRDIQYGFRWGVATVTRLFSDEKKGWVTVGVETEKVKLQIHVTKTGKIRIHDEQGCEWLPTIADCIDAEGAREEER